MEELSMEEKLKILEEKERKRKEGSRKGGLAPKTFTDESKQRQRDGAKRGGKHSHIHDKRG